MSLVSTVLTVYRTVALIEFCLVIRENLAVDRTERSVIAASANVKKAGLVNNAIAKYQRRHA